MRKPSTAKLVFAMLVLCLYTFRFGIVNSIGEALPVPNEQVAAFETSEAASVVVTAATLPPVTEPPVTSPPITETTSPPVTTVAATKAPVTTAPPATTAPPETTPAATTPPETTPPETSPPVTTIPETTPPEEVPAGGWSGNLSVSSNGSTVTDSAFEIVCRVVANEMGVGGAFHKEALKAQAVASYTYIRYYNDRGSTPSVGLRSSVPQSIRDAVAEVAGQVMLYNNKPILAVYCSATGGSTASSLDVWGTNLAYLRSVTSEYDASGAYYGYETKLSASELQSMAQSRAGISLSGDPSGWIELLPESEGGIQDGGYLGKIRLGGHTITARTLRESILSLRIRSTKFSVSYVSASDSFVFTTYGYGHGVGLSQHGANQYALNGYSYRQILEHYYSGAALGSL